MTLPEGESVDSEAVTADLEALDASLAEALPELAHRLVRLDRRRRVRLDRRHHRLRRRLPPARSRLRIRREPRGREGRKRGRRRRNGRGLARPPDRLRRPVRGLGRGRRRPQPPDRGAHRRLRRAPRPDLRLRLVPRRRAAPDGVRLDHDHVPPAPRPDRGHDGLADRPVPDRADRPGRRDRLLAHRRLALARGADPRRIRRGGRADRDGDRRPRRRLLGHHGRDRPSGADRASPSVPALDGLRRHADPARLDPRRDHPPPRRAREVRRQARLAAPAHRRQGEPHLDPLGRGRLPAPLARGRSWAWRS